MFGKFPHPSHHRARRHVHHRHHARPSTSTTASWARSSTGARSSAASGTTWCDFFLDANPAYEQVGARPTNLAQTGIWDNSRGTTTPPTPTATHGATSGGPRPAVIIEGKLVTTKLTDINIGIEEFIEHSFYDDWTKTGPQRYRTDPLGNPLSPYHAVEQDHPPQAHGHQLQGALHLGHRSPLGPPGGRDRRLRPAVGHRPAR